MTIRIVFVDDDINILHAPRGRQRYRMCRPPATTSLRQWKRTSHMTHGAPMRTEQRVGQRRADGRLPRRGGACHGWSAVRSTKLDCQVARSHRWLGVSL
jgi:hypothetical protein